MCGNISPVPVSHHQYVYSFCNFNPVFTIAALVMLNAMFVSFKLKGNSKAKKVNRFYFRKKFTKYYMLEMSYGARKQVFFTFGPYVLILFCKADVGVVI